MQWEQHSRPICVNGSHVADQRERGRTGRLTPAARERAADAHVKSEARAAVLLRPLGSARPPCSPSTGPRSAPNNAYAASRVRENRMNGSTGRELESITESDGASSLPSSLSRSRSPLRLHRGLIDSDVGHDEIRPGETLADRSLGPGGELPGLVGD